MKNAFLVLDDLDNVATALTQLNKGEAVNIERNGSVQKLQLLNDIPMGHKFALEMIPVEMPVKKYGAAIGLSTSSIQPGEHVHLHNIESQRGRGDR